MIKISRQNLNKNFVAFASLREKQSIRKKMKNTVTVIVGLSHFKHTDQEHDQNLKAL